MKPTFRYFPISFLLIAAVFFNAAHAANPQSAVVETVAELRADIRITKTETPGQEVSRLTELAAASRESGDRPSEISALSRIGEVQASHGYPDRAIPVLEDALRVASNLQDSDLEAAIHAQLGNVTLMQNLPQLAANHFRSALALANRGENHALIASIQNDLGRYYLATGETGLANRHLSDALALAESAGESFLLVKVRINSGHAASTEGNFADAASYYRAAYTGIPGLVPSSTKGYALVEIGRGLAGLSREVQAEQTGLREQASRILDEAVKLGETLGDERVQSWARGYLGGLSADDHRTTKARALLEHAVLSAQRADAPELLYRWYWRLARIFRDSGEPQVALDYYRLAVPALRLVVSRAPRGIVAGEPTAYSKLNRLLHEFADLLLESGRSKAQREDAELFYQEARDTLELQNAAELEDYFQDDCVAALRAKTRKLDQTVGPHTAVLYPVVFKDRLELLISFVDGMEVRRVDVDAVTLRAEISTFRQLLEKRTTRQYLPHAQRLYSWIIRPVEPLLNSHDTDTLVIVPDATLRTIPLTALHDGDHFLVSNYALAVTPGLELTDPRPLPMRDARVLLMGLTESVQGYPALAYVDSELHSVEAQLGGDVLKDREFISRNVVSEFENNTYNIVHIASHGEFSTNSSDSFLLTYDSRLTMDELEQTIGVARFRDEPVELLTLSACQTAAGDDRAALGLAGVAIKSGARSALATLWSVNDEATTMLISEFYRQLGDPAITKSEALRSAQLKLLEDPRYSHPAYWSPFVIIGNWL